MADASLRAAISASISLAARSAAIRSWMFAASSFALYALMRPVTTGPPMRLASQLHMALVLLRAGIHLCQLLVVPAVGKIAQELEERGDADEDDRPGPGRHLCGDRAHVDAAHNRRDEVIAADGYARRDHDHGRKLLLDALEFLAHRGEHALFAAVELHERR